jgi:hypothetical protein
MQRYIGHRTVANEGALFFATFSNRELVVLRRPAENALSCRTSMQADTYLATLAPLDDEMEARLQITAKATTRAVQHPALSKRPAGS